ncbi:eukaryotic type KH-domain type I [Pyrrhoderma noxium]|uniref:Eukaryotic type KH-domain type I n=1 Tax=Pyrrhoderma noxium TaxID=2282107 RepID=A0A286ULK2_9AGAM|nr:eukaryotic type KH-domain type I [Pyrrhoderma noxium]
MSSKRKWDQASPEDELFSAKVQRAEDGKTASEAAAAAAAIAAKIAAQFAGGTTNGTVLGPRDPHDSVFTHDIDINDVRNRYVLTKGSTQEQINLETGANVTTKGVWYPDRSKASEKDPPLYLHISANTQKQIDDAVDKIKELMDMDMGPLVEDKKDMRRERRRWPEEKLQVGLESLRNFNVRAKVVGPQGVFVKYIQTQTSTRVQIKGLGSGFIDTETGRESDEPMHIHISGPDEGQVARAKALTEDLLEVVRAEHAKARTALQQQQMELHQAQAAYAAYSANYSGYTPQPPSAPAPPPPSGDAPPPPPGAPPPAPDGSQPPPPPGGDPSSSAPTDADAYAKYWAAYGYDVNSPQFKEWQSQQMAQYYAQAGYGAGAAANSGSPPAPPSSAPPPPPSSDPAPPPPPS